MMFTAKMTKASLLMTTTILMFLIKAKEDDLLTIAHRAFLEQYLLTPTVALEHSIEVRRLKWPPVSICLIVAWENKGDKTSIIFLIVDVQRLVN